MDRLGTTTSSGLAASRLPRARARRALRAAARRMVPAPARPAARSAYLHARYRGDDLECPCCGSRFGRFIPDRGRPNAVCPDCGLQERHRAMWIYLRDRTDLLTGSHRVLHFAPEPVLQERLRALPGIDHVGADLDSPVADHHFDITAIPFADSSFDVILCSHVLEHVPDDHQAMRELRRVLRPDGWALVLVPIDHGRATTYEDPAITSPEDREREFWQPDHVRLYGRDFPDRLAAAGFDVSVDDYIAKLDPEVVARHALAGHRMFVCRPAADR